MVVAAGLVGALILAAYRQVDIVRVVLVFQLPLLALGLAEVLRGDPLEGFGTLLVLAALILGLGFGIYRSVVLLRGRRPRTEVNKVS